MDKMDTSQMLKKKFEFDYICFLKMRRKIIRLKSKMIDGGQNQSSKTCRVSCKFEVILLDSELK